MTAHAMHPSFTDPVGETPDLARPVALAREPAFRLGAMTVRPGSREVVGPRGRDVLEPRVMQVLVALARAQGGIVTRDDLVATCWDGRAISEDAITRVISRLRRLSEARGRCGWALETITKVGYRLLADGQAPEAAVPAQPSRSPSRRLLLGVGAATVAAAGAGGAFWRLRPHRASPQAQLLFQKGRDAIAQGMAADNAQAIGFLKAAVAQSPDYAQAWGALALAYHGALDVTEPARQAGVSEQARAAARRALALDPNQADAAVCLALLAPLYRNWANAERGVVHALARHPREPRLEIGYSRLLQSVGRVREAVTAARIGVEGDAFAPWYPWIYASTLWAVGRTEEAEQRTRAALALWPRQHALWFLLFNLLAHSGRADEALAFAADVDRRPPSIPTPDIEQHMRSARALMTRAPVEVDAAVAAEMAAARRGVGYAENAINTLSALGRLDEAFFVARGLYLNEGFRLGDQRFSSTQPRYMRAGGRFTYTLFEPPVAPMRGDPRFAQLMADIGLVAYWKATGKRPDDLAWAGEALR